MFRRSKKLAAALGALLLGTGGAMVAAAPAASAGTVTYRVHCVPPSAGGGPFDFDAQVELTVSPVKPVYAVGDRVDVTWTFRSASNNPSSVTVNADSVRPVGTVHLSGAQGGQVAMSGPQKNAATGPGEPLWLAPMTGSFTVTRPGTITLAPGAYTSIASMYGTWETPCTPVETPTPVAHTLTVDGTIPQPTLALSRSLVRPVKPFQLSGENWPVGATPAVALCAPDGTACRTDRVSGTGLGVDAQGRLVGDATIAAGTAEGDYRVRVTAGSTSLAMPIGVSYTAPVWAEPIVYEVRCQELPFSSTFLWKPQVALEVSPQKAYYTAGEQVTVTWRWKVWPRNPQPAGIWLLKDTVVPSGTVKVTGAQSGTVAVSGPKINPATEPLAAVQVSDMTGTFTVTANGAIDLAPADYTLKPLAQTSTCTPTGTPAVSTRMFAGTAPVKPATLTADRASAPAGSTLNLLGTYWPVGAIPSVALCAADGSACDPARITDSTLVIGGDNLLSGAVTLHQDAPAGPRAIRVTAGSVSMTVPLTVEPAPNPRTLTPTPSHGPVGTAVTVSGARFTPNTDILVRGVTASGDLTNDVVLTRSKGDGTFAVVLRVTRTTTAQISALEGIADPKGATAPFTIDPAEPGTLEMSQAGTGIAFDPVVAAGSGQHMTGALNTVTIRDQRGSTLGWTLSGSVTDFVSDEGGVLPGDGLTWAPHCAAGPSSVSPVSAGPQGTVKGATLCSAPAASDPDQPTGGAFTADAELRLSVPPFPLSGVYRATLTLTLT